MAEPLKKVETEDNLEVWAEEAERRYEEIRSGKIEMIPHAVVMEQLRLASALSPGRSDRVRGNGDS